MVSRKRWSTMVNDGLQKTMVDDGGHFSYVIITIVNDRSKRSFNNGLTMVNDG